MKNSGKISSSNSTPSNPQTIGGVEREETPLEEYIRARDYYIDRLEAHLAGKPVRDMCEAQLWFKSAESAWRKSIEHQLSVIGELKRALNFISQMKGMTLIAPSMGEDCDHAHQVGAAKAFDQAADAAIEALSHPIIGGDK